MQKVNISLLSYFHDLEQMTYEINIWENWQKINNGLKIM